MKTGMTRTSEGSSGVTIRRMQLPDVASVIAIATALPQAPHWLPESYLTALDPASSVRRVALVAQASITLDRASHIQGSAIGTPWSSLIPAVNLDAPCPILSASSAERVGGPSLHLRAGSAALEVVGFAIASVLPPQAEIETIAVSPAEQRNGIGRLLLSALLEELTRMEVTEVLLEARQSNRPALSLYRSLGFGQTAVRLGYYADPQEDALLMVLQMPSPSGL